ncbi:hypothetical protein Fot_35279 [Forsythia ovata]|uniref:Uncharacterized protein n=1 Tax=Forsythia ovata TaxID=205694 RepID=A0ABD1SL39_9LAMI
MASVPQVRALHSCEAKDFLRWLAYCEVVGNVGFQFHLTNFPCLPILDFFKNFSSFQGFMPAEVKVKKMGTGGNPRDEEALVEGMADPQDDVGGGDKAYTVNVDNVESGMERPSTWVTSEVDSVITEDVMLGL